MKLCGESSVANSNVENWESRMFAVGKKRTFTSGSARRDEPHPYDCF